MSNNKKRRAKQEISQKDGLCPSGGRILTTAKAKSPPQAKFDTVAQLGDTVAFDAAKSRESLERREESELETESDAPFFAADAAIIAADAAIIAATAEISTVKAKQEQPRRAGSARPEGCLPSTKPPSPAPQKQTMSEKKRLAHNKRMKRRKEHTRTFSHIFGSVVLVAFAIGVSAFSAHLIVRAFLDFTGINVVEFLVEVEIPAEATAEEIAAILTGYEIISMPRLFVHYGRLSEKDGGFLHGTFELTSAMSYSQIYHTLQNRSRSTETVEVTIPEGLTALEIAQLLEENFVCRATDFMEFYRYRMDRFDFELRLEENPLKFNQMEGFLFPDTYEFFVVNGLEDDPDIDTRAYAEVVARTMFFNFNSHMAREIYRGIYDLGKTFTLPGDREFGLDEFITLASMVQWEAANPEDMQKVASVFLNRLRRPSNYPFLESDVTRRYARLNIEPYRTPGNAAQLDTMMSLYSTHITAGLPPGPINNPGMNAILAVLDAPRTEYYFFCADLETGQTFFARTLHEHEQNLRRANLIDAEGNQIFA